MTSKQSQNGREGIKSMKGGVNAKCAHVHTRAKKRGVKIDHRMLTY